jgi:hypothetical protein
MAIVFASSIRRGDYASLEALPGVMVFGGADPLPRHRDLIRALRHADVSIVIDLSHTPHQEKIEYLHSVLPALATLRRHTGLPHRIIVDEAHYFLDDPHAPGMLDLDTGGYTLVTYRASKLRPDLLAKSQAVIVTRESDPGEVRALRALCHSCEAPRLKTNGGIYSRASSSARQLPRRSRKRRKATCAGSI